MMTIATRCEDRREMVRKLSGFLSQPAIYLRTPTYAFQIGGITVNRDASVSGEPDHLTLVACFLLDNGYINELPAGLNEAHADSEAVADDDPEAAPAYEQPADSEAPANPEADEAPVTQSEDVTGPVDRISVSLPLNSCTPQGLINILRTLYARQNLIAAMTRCDFIRMDEEVIDLLNDSRPDSIAQISELLRREAEAGMITGVAVEEDKLKLDTCYNRENPTGWNDFAELLTAVTDRAMKAHRVSSKRVEPLDSEMKYFCRSWLMQLGMGGADFKATRAALLNHLHGYAAFRTADRMAAHRSRQAGLRKSRKESEENSHEEN